MSKKNLVLVTAISVLALSIGVGAGFGVFVFHEGTNNTKEDFVLPNEEMNTMGIDHLVYQVGYTNDTKLNGTITNHVCFFVDPETNQPLTDSASLKKNIPFKGNTIPFGTESKVGIPVLFKIIDDNYVVDSDYTFVGWSQLKNKIYQMVDDETRVPDMHSFVCDGYNITARNDGTKNTADPTGLYLYPSFYRSKIRCYGEWEFDEENYRVTLPFMKSQITYLDESNKKKSTKAFFAFRLVNMPDFDRLVLTSSNHTCVSFEKGNLFANAVKPYDIFVRIIENDDNNHENGYLSTIDELDALNYAHYDQSARISNLDGEFNFDISFYYKKEAK